jgi:hypothetical protein
MTKRNFGAALATFGLLVGGSLTHIGCSDSSSGKFYPPPASSTDSGQAQVALSSAQTTNSAAALALGATLSFMNTGSFVGLQNPPAVTATGDPNTVGTVTVDFGTGTVVNNAIISGQIVSTFTRSGNDATITTVFNGFETTTTAHGTATTVGTLTTTTTMAGTVATGTITGSVTTTQSGDATTVTPNLTYSYDGTAGTIVLNGTSAIVSSSVGSWTATLTNVAASVTAATREITSGSVRLDRSGIPISLNFVITGPNTGTVTITPGGITQSFTL